MYDEHRTTHDNEHDTTTCPYLEGDPVMVVIEGTWRLGTVIGTARRPHAPFGLRWQLTVLTYPDTTPHVAYCDDDGRNFTRGKEVCAV